MKVRLLRKNNWMKLFTGMVFDEGEVTGTNINVKRYWNFSYEDKDACVNPYVMVSLEEFGPGIVFEEV